MFSLFNFTSFFQDGQLTPLAPMCGRPWLRESCVCYRAATGRRVGKIRHVSSNMRFAWTPTVEDKNTLVCRVEINSNLPSEKVLQI